MTHHQLRTALKRLHLSQLRFARLVGVDARTARRWVLGEGRIPHAIALLVAAWERYPSLIPHPLKGRRP